MRRVAPQVAAVQGMRYYSAGGALVKTEVEGRIMSLLAGFDKVGGFVFVFVPVLYADSCFLCSDGDGGGCVRARLNSLLTAVFD